ncbi:MAG: hypothetical protein Unbinned6004contig1002_36 [Prokaryotic dsDNA virus sp.]|nr:MAG: hypothetical protein Unbinned6004contig1002_36 [Prokaryotic dsDNA virus sp.]|tara:strand:- start:2081 stop:2620 length:540 start_codon:yes stop_codon:yes gene_type:complete
MAGQRLTDKTDLGKQTASDDIFMIVDKSDTTGSSVGTSKKVDAKHIIQTDKITLSNAEYTSLNTAAKTLVAAPGANNMIIPFSVVILYTQGATANTASSTLFLGFKGISTSHYWDFFKSWTMGNSGISYYFTQANASGLGDATLNNSTVNEPFIMYTSKPPTGTGVADIYVTYQIVNIS